MVISCAGIGISRGLIVLGALVVVMAIGTACDSEGDRPTATAAPSPTAVTETASAGMVATPSPTPTAPAASPTRDPFWQAAAPTHTQPTPWGLFIINPVINGQSLLNPQTSPVPNLSPSAKRVEASGPTALDRAAAAGVPWVKVQEKFVANMELNGLFSAQDGDAFSFAIHYGAGDGTPDFRSLIVSGYTPTEGVTFEEFPDNAIHDFSANHDVRGYPTLTVFPDEGTADPRSEREVAWSQGRAVYFVKTTGIFRDDDVLEIARDISAQQEEGK